MKKWTIDKIFQALFFVLLVVVLIYAYFTFCFSIGNTRTFFMEIFLSLINGLFLALVVFVAGMFLEEKRKKELKAENQNERIITLINLLKNVFRRGKSSWNFTNNTQGFYFDNSRINSLYNLLTENKREWDVFLQGYKKDIDDDNELVESLSGFVKDMEKALINAEELDNKLKSKKLYPALAASMGSGYPVMRDEAKKNTNFAYWIYRATWAGASATEIMFGMSPVTDQQLNIGRNKGLISEANSLGDTAEFKKSVLMVQADRVELEKCLSKIKKLVK
jgi:hypothetical protein